MLVGGNKRSCLFRSVCVTRGCVVPLFSVVTSIRCNWKKRNSNDLLSFALRISVLSEGQQGDAMRKIEPSVPTLPVSKIGHSSNGSGTKAIGPFPPQRGIRAKSEVSAYLTFGLFPLEISAISLIATTLHPSGILPNSESVNRSGNRAVIFGSRWSR